MNTTLPTYYDGVDQVTDEMANDLFVAAIEGGINYWGQVERYMPGSELSSAYVIDLEQMRPYYVQSNLKNWKRAIVLAAKEFNMTIADFYEDHDANSGDAAMQIYCFKEIVYS